MGLHDLDLMKDIREKGWTGLRKLKLYLKGIPNNPLYAKNDLIEKTEFKFHIYRWGISSLKDCVKLNLSWEKYLAITVSTCGLYLK